jgi:DNA-binding NarL/FixJ family response regulator
MEVLDLVRLGLSNRDIAERLGISLAGVKFHLTEIISGLE